LADDYRHDISVSSLKVFGQPLIIRNIQAVSTILHIDKIMIPEGFSDLAKLVQDNFPFITTEESSDNCHYDDNNKHYDIKIDNHYYEWLQARTAIATVTTQLIKDDNTKEKIKGGGAEPRLEVPLNAFIHCITKRQQMGGEDPYHRYFRYFIIVHISSALLDTPAQDN
jgi:hypothetical protein